MGQLAAEISAENQKTEAGNGRELKGGEHGNLLMSAVMIRRQQLRQDPYRTHLLYHTRLLLSGKNAYRYC